MSLRLLIVASAAIGVASVAHAQDVVIEGDVPVVVEQAPPDDVVIVPETVPGPRVYGWTLRPADCGTFRYWDGVRCADARDEPPVGE
jgi:hypothetical protein